MAEQQTLRAYLMKLGFKVDKDSEARFKRSVTTGVQITHGLRRALLGMATASGVGIAALARFTGQLDALGKVAKHLHMKPDQVKAMGDALAQNGFDAQAAVSALTALQSRMRQFGSRAVLAQMEQFGIKTRDALGKPLDKGQLLLNTLAELKKHPQAQATAQMQALGLDPKLLDLNVAKAREARKESEKYYKSVGFNDMVSKSADTENQIRRLKVQLESLAVAATSALEDAFGGNLRDLANWLNAHHKEIEGTLQRWSKGLVSFGKKAKYWFEKLQELTGGWGAKIVAAQVALKTLTGISLVGTIASVGKLGAKLAMAAGNATALAAGMGGIGKGKAAKEGSKLGKLLPWLINPVTGTLAGIYGFYATGDPEIRGNDRGGTGKVTKDYKQKHAKQNQRIREGVAYFKAKLGLTTAQAIGLVSNLMRESGLNPGAVNPDDNGSPSAGIAQWHGSRIKEIEKRTGKKPSELSYKESLGQVAYELKHSHKNVLQMLKNAGDMDAAQAVVERGYEVTANPERSQKTNRQKAARIINVLNETPTKPRAVQSVQAPAKTKTPPAVPMGELFPWLKSFDPVAVQNAAAASSVAYHRSSSTTTNSSSAHTTNNTDNSTTTVQMNVEGGDEAANRLREYLGQSTQTSTARNARPITR